MTLKEMLLLTVSKRMCVCVCVCVCSCVQMIGHPMLLPSAIHDDLVVKANADDCYYFHCVQFIRQVVTIRVPAGAFRSWAVCRSVLD